MLNNEDKNINLIALEDVSDPRNIGSIIRSAVSFNINGIISYPMEIRYNQYTVSKNFSFKIGFHDIYIYIYNSEKKIICKIRMDSDLDNITITELYAKNADGKLINKLDKVFVPLVGQEHRETIDAHTPSGGGGQCVFQSNTEVLVTSLL